MNLHDPRSDVRLLLYGLPERETRAGRFAIEFLIDRSR